MGKGDHIKVRRFGGMYSHHGIDLGDGTVIHFSGEPFRQDEACVCRVGMEEFLHGGKAIVMDHPVTARDAEEVVREALAMEGQVGYDLWRNNCEHFAWYCKTGTKYSKQVKRAMKAAGVVATGALVLGSSVAMAALRGKTQA